MKKIIILFMAFCLLGRCALADVEVTGDRVNLRQGPGSNFQVIANVRQGTVLGDRNRIETDENGVSWCGVTYNGIDCWIAATYTKIIGGTHEPRTDSIALEAYCSQDLKWAAQELNLTDYEYTGGEMENSYYNDDLSLLGTATVDSMTITGNGYTLFGAALGMMWYEALDACVKNDLYVVSAYEDRIVLEREAPDPDSAKSFINLSLDEDGAVREISWSVDTTD